MTTAAPVANADRYLVKDVLLALLFGWGFAVQMERLLARGAAFQTIYLRHRGRFVPGMSNSGHLGG